jgi:multimeric flavodoxin WrbA
MSASKHLLIVSHVPSPNTAALTEALVRGASHLDVEGVAVKATAPLEANAEDVLRADALILGTTENFGYMSGALKDFFDRIYYPCLEKTEGLPYGLLIRAGNDGSGAHASIERIVTGLRWRLVHDPVMAVGEFRPEYLEHCETLGMTLAAGLAAGVF